MNVQSLSCPSCGGPIKVPEDLEYFNCAYCGVGLQVQHGEGYIALKLAKEVGRAIKESGAETQAAIREGTQLTRSELKRLQFSQELSTAQLRLSNVRAEIRSLERSKKNRRTKRQLNELNNEEAEVIQRVNALTEALNPTPTSPTVKQSAKKKRPSKFRTGCLWGCATYLIVGIILALLATPFDAILFKSSNLSAGEMGPLGYVGAMIGFTVGVLVFIYYQNPNASVWKSVNQLLARTPLASWAKKAGANLEQPIEKQPSSANQATTENESGEDTAN